MSSWPSGDEALYAPGRLAVSERASSSCVRPNQRMQLTGRRGARPRVLASLRSAAVEALVCVPLARTARS